MIQWNRTSGDLPLKKSFQSKYSEVLETRQDTSVNRIDLDAIEKEISIDIAELRRDLRHSLYIYKESKLLATISFGTWQQRRNQLLGQFGSAVDWNKKQPKKLVQP